MLQAKQDATELQEKTKAMKSTIAELEAKENQIIADRDAALVPIGYIVHDSVPVSDNEVSVSLSWYIPISQQPAINQRPQQGLTGVSGGVAHDAYRLDHLPATQHSKSSSWVAALGAV